MGGDCDDDKGKKETPSSSSWLDSFGDFFSGVTEFGSCATNGVTADTITCFITKNRVEDFLKYIETEDKFYKFVLILLPKLYIRICVRYITPIVVFVLMLGASTYGLYYNGILYQYEQYVMDIFDSIAESAADNVIYSIRRLRRIARFGRALNTRNEAIIPHIHYNNLRTAYTRISSEALNSVDSLNDPVKILFGAM